MVIKTGKNSFGCFCVIQLGSKMVSAIGHTTKKEAIAEAKQLIGMSV